MFSAKQPWHCFLCKNKSSRNGLKIYGDILWTKREPRTTRVGPEESWANDKVGGMPYPPAPGRVPLPCLCLVDPFDVTPTVKITINTKKPNNKPRSGVLPPQASVATKKQSRARSGTLPEGETITCGHLHHPGGLHDKEGVVHPRGWGYVPVATCLISLSLSCSWFGTILMYRELCYYSWILWCFSPSTLL